MEENSVSFVEWKEEYVSQERGSRIVHYILKDSCGKSVLAVVGTERSLRHMVYVVAEEFLSYSGNDNTIQAGFKWRSRREVVDWLTSMLAKQQQSDSPSGDSTYSLGSSELLSSKYFSADKVDRRVRNLKQSYSDIVWLGAPWTCGKQLKHFPAFSRNSTTIAVQSFVFVMAKEGNRYVAYLEDMYEDKKGMKKVKVRWFHHSQEVKNIIRLRNVHPKEVYITPYTQVISVECVDGPAIVLTREHFEKCLEGFSDALLGKLHLCCRQFRSNKIKPFDLRKLRGYYNQPIISCLDSETFLNSDSVCRGVIGNRFKNFGFGDSVGKGTKRKRSYGVRESFLTNHTSVEGLEKKKLLFAPFSKSGASDTWDKRLLSFKNGESQRLHIQLFKADDKIELLCQDSGIRGCWFRCIVLEISRKQMKLQYMDLQDEDGCGNLEEWIPAFRLAATDKLGMRCAERPTIRPCPPEWVPAFRLAATDKFGMRCAERPTIRPCPPVSDSVDIEFEVGAPVDAWWSDGWWEGVVVAVKDAKDDFVQVYAPGENKFLNVPKKDLRVSRDWLGGKWMDVKANPNILITINAETKQPVVSTIRKDDDVDNSTRKIKLDENEDKIDYLPAPASSAGHPEQVSSSDKDYQDDDHNVNEKSHDISFQDNMCCDGDDQNVALKEDDDADDSSLKVKLDENELTELPAHEVSVSHPEQVTTSDEVDQDDDRNNVSLQVQDMCFDGAGDDNDGRKEGESGTEDAVTAAQTDEALVETDAAQELL